MKNKVLASANKWGLFFGVLFLLFLTSGLLNSYLCSGMDIFSFICLVFSLLCFIILQYCFDKRRIVKKGEKALDQITSTIEFKIKKGNVVTGAPLTNAEISQIEQELSVEIIAPSYTDFIKKFGWVSFHSKATGEKLKILGLDSINSTKKFREFGMPHHYVVFMDLEHYAYCINTSKFSKGFLCEQEIVKWHKEPHLSHSFGMNFIDFVSIWFE